MPSPVTLAPGSHPGRDDRQQIFTGARLPQFQIEIIQDGGADGVHRPRATLVFSRKLEAAKHTGLMGDALAQRYVREFDRKWHLRG